MNWDRFGIEMLREVVVCIGGHGLASVCECLADDYSAWMSGMPDLLLWHTGASCISTSELPTVVHLWRSVVMRGPS